MSQQQVTTTISTPDGRILETVVVGDPSGGALVYHSGTPSSIGEFDLLFDAAARHGLATLWWSRAGYGTSTPNPGRSVGDGALDTAVVLDALDVDSAYVLGWSGGGPHALGTAALLSERTRAVATIGSVAPYGAAGLDFLAGMGEENIEEFTLAIEGGPGFDAFLEQGASGFALVSEDNVIEALGGLISQVDADALASYFAAPLVSSTLRAAIVSPAGWGDDDRAFLAPWGFDPAAITVPTSIWQGGQDKMVPASHGAWLADTIPGVRAHLLEDDGHISLWAKIDEILTELVGIDGTRS